MTISVKILFSVIPLVPTHMLDMFLPLVSDCSFEYFGDVMGLVIQMGLAIHVLPMLLGSSKPPSSFDVVGARIVLTLVQLLAFITYVVDKTHRIVAFGAIHGRLRSNEEVCFLRNLAVISVILC